MSKWSQGYDKAQKWRKKKNAGEFIDLDLTVMVEECNQGNQGKVYLENIFIFCYIEELEITLTFYRKNSPDFELFNKMSMTVTSDDKN